MRLRLGMTVVRMGRRRLNGAVAVIADAKGAGRRPRLLVPANSSRAPIVFADGPVAATPIAATIRWNQQPGSAAGAFRVRYDCYCTVQAPAAHPDDGHAEAQPHLKPKPRAHLRTEPGIETDDPVIAACARELTAGLDRPADQARAIYRFVEQDIVSEPSIAGVSFGAVECLKQGAGDSAAKSRLLAALCRNCGVSARLVTGLTLTKDDEQLPHVWVEAWLRDHWLPMCPFYHHFGHVPRTYVVFGYGDLRLVRGRNVTGLTCAFHVERLPANAAPIQGASWPHQFFTRLSLHACRRPSSDWPNFYCCCRSRPWSSA